MPVKRRSFRTIFYFSVPQLKLLCPAYTEQIFLSPNTSFNLTFNATSPGVRASADELCSGNRFHQYCIRFVLMFSKYNVLFRPFSPNSDGRVWAKRYCTRNGTWGSLTHISCASSTAVTLSSLVSLTIMYCCIKYGRLGVEKFAPTWGVYFTSN